MYMTKTENAALRDTETDWMVFHRWKSAGRYPLTENEDVQKLLIIIFQLPGVVCVRIFLCFLCS